MALQNKNMNNENINVEIKIKKEDRDSEKYKVALKLINLILVNLGNTEIKDLTEFVNVDREDIIKDINKQSLIGMEGELFPLFNKKDSGYYRKTGGFVLNCLRGLMKEIGYALTKIKKSKSEQINGKSYERKHYLYSIK